MEQFVSVFFIFCSASWLSSKKWIYPSSHLRWMKESFLLCYNILTVGLLFCQNILISAAANWLHTLTDQIYSNSPFCDESIY